MTEASKRPWRVSSERCGSEWISIEIDEPNISRSIGSMYMFGEATNLANANLIVHAVNNFDEIKAALVLAQKTLATLVNIEGIKHTTVINAYAQVVEAEAKARAVLAKIEE